MRANHVAQELAEKSDVGILGNRGRGLSHIGRILALPVRRRYPTRDGGWSPMRQPVRALYSDPNDDVCTHRSGFRIAGVQENAFETLESVDPSDIVVAGHARSVDGTDIGGCFGKRPAPRTAGV